MSGPLLLECDRVTKRFPGVLALDQVSFDLKAGEVHALCGENGAGKSTLIKVLCGIWAHGSYEGEVRIEGESVHFTGIADSEAAGIAVIYQELALVPEMTVAENIVLGNEPTRWGLIDWDQAYATTQNLLEKYDIDLDPTARVMDLGVGQQQLVEIVKALSKNTRILLLDEPTAALTETESELLLGIIRQLRDHGVTCVYISHRLEEVLDISSRITIIRDGKSIKTLDTSETDRDEIIRHMVGRSIDDLFPRETCELGDLLLEVANLTVMDPKHPRPVLENIAFQVRAGEILGIGGLMGSGRSELLMHLIGGYGERTGGDVRMASEPLPQVSPAEAIHRGLVLVSEDRKRYGAVLGQSIRFNLSLSSLRQFVAALLIDGDAEVHGCQDYFKKLGVKAPGLETEAGSLSGGNQQKVVLGKALMTRPKVVLLDEPTRGIDVGAKREIYELMNLLTSEGLAVVMVSSELPELMGMSDRYLILSAGKIGGAFDDSNATQEDLMAAAMAYH